MGVRGAESSLAMDNGQAKVLLVDDQPENLVALEAILEVLGQTLVQVMSGADALRKLLNDDFAVILMDVVMPGMDGFETASLIRQRARSQHTPIIFLTAVGDSEAHVFRGYSVGAIDYLVKPVVAEVLRSKVAAFVDLFKKTEQVKKQAEQLRQHEQREHSRQLIEVRQQFETERVRLSLQVARDIQQKFFPATAPVYPGWDIYGASYPAEATGGDYFDYFGLADGTLGIAIGDVSGHGFGPALVMATTRAYLRALGQTEADPVRILSLANRALADDMLEGHFVTLLLARFDPGRRMVTYASAGHSEGYLFSCNGELKNRLDSTGWPLGISSDISLDAAEDFIMQSGDVLCLLTDGVAEAMNASDEQFGQKRVIELVSAHSHQPARQIVDAIHGAVSVFAQGQTYADDVTAIVLKAT